MKRITKLLIPKQDFRQIAEAIRKSGVKYYPFRKLQDGYHIDIEPADHPLVTYLTLKYDINIV